MLATQPKTSSGPPRLLLVRRLGLKVFNLMVVGVLFGYAYGWAAPRLYRPEIKAGFWLGSAHGALMPIALPSLVVGKDVPIFTANNTGRTYKLGYIAGINLCGLVFFGLAFSRTQGARLSGNLTEGN